MKYPQTTRKTLSETLRRLTLRRAYLEANNPRLMTRSSGEHARIERQISTLRKQLEVTA